MTPAGITIEYDPTAIDVIFIVNVQLPAGIVIPLMVIEDPLPDKVPTPGEQLFVNIGAAAKVTFELIENGPNEALVRGAPDGLVAVIVRVAVCPG